MYTIAAWGHIGSQFQAADGFLHHHLRADPESFAPLQFYRGMNYDRFPTNIAEQYSVNAAILYQYLSFRAEKTQTRSIRISLRELASKYTYLSTKQIRVALDTLMTGDRNRCALVVRNIDEGTQVCRYTVLKLGELGVEPGAPHRINIEVAEQLGVIPAVVYNNIENWVRANWKNAAAEALNKLDVESYNGDAGAMNYDSFVESRHAAWTYKTPKSWHEDHKYTALRSVERAFALLAEKGWLVKLTNPSRVPAWTLSDEALTLIMATNIGTKPTS